MGKKANDDEEDDLPDLKDKGVQDAALKIQSVYRGFQTRKEFQARTTTTKDMQKPVKGKVLPMTKIKVDEREIKRARKTPKKMVLDAPLEENRTEELLRHPGDVVAAAITLQRFFRKL